MVAHTKTQTQQTANDMTANDMTANDMTANLQDLFKPLQDSFGIAKAQAEKVFETSQQTASRNYEQALSLTRTHTETTRKSLISGYEELSNLTRANVNAAVESTQIATQGFETLGQEMASFARQKFEAQTALFQKLMGARTLKDVFEVQSEATRQSVDTVMSQGAKVADMSVNHANEALAPIQNQATATFEKAAKTRAAA